MGFQDELKKESVVKTKTGAKLGFRNAMVLGVANIVLVGECLGFRIIKIV